MLIIDSDQLSIWLRRGGSEYSQRLERFSRYDRTAFVSFHEQIGGWQKYIARARDSAGVGRGYRQLEVLLRDFADGYQDVSSPWTNRQWIGRYLAKNTDRGRWS